MFTLICFVFRSGNAVFASLLANKSPLHHSSMNAAASKGLLTNATQLSGSSKNSIGIANSNAAAAISTSAMPKDLLNFQDQMKKNRPPSKPGDGFASTTPNSILNTNQMRNMQASMAPSNQSQAPLRRPASGNSPQQVLLSSDDEIMDDSLVGK